MNPKERFPFPVSRRLASIGLALATVTPTALAVQALDEFQKELAQRTLQREVELGLARLPLGGGRFEYRLPAGTVTPDVREEDGLIWLYDGQEAFAEAGEPARPALVYVEPEQPSRPIEEELLGTVEVDELGRRWLLIHVDGASFDAKRAAYDERVRRTFGEPEPLAGPEDLEPELLDPGGWALYEPATWYLTNCDSDSDKEIRRWNSDNRVESSDPMTTRQRKVLRITSPRGSGSAFMVDSEWAMTAAHVVTNSSGTKYSTSSISLCTYGNYQSGAGCYGITRIKVVSGYSGDGDMSDDYALVKLSSSPGVGWMAISSASNSTLKSHDSYKTGHPGYGPGCASTSESPVVSGYGASTQYWSKGDLFGTTTKRIKTRLDAGPGESGAPYYYYPGGCCGSHYVTGLHSGFVNPGIGKSYNGGPKGPKFRDWVIANI